MSFNIRGIEANLMPTPMILEPIQELTQNKFRTVGGLLNQFRSITFIKIKPFLFKSSMRTQVLLY